MVKGYCLEYILLLAISLANIELEVSGLKTMTLNLMLNGELIILSMITASTGVYQVKRDIQLCKKLLMQPIDQFTILSAVGVKKMSGLGDLKSATVGEQH
jgi:hypothetical protein